MVSRLEDAVLDRQAEPVQWLVGDDKCDCAFQRIGEWGNPYLASTLQIRMCCIWKELSKMFPQFVQEVPVYWDSNQRKPVTVPREWDSEDMDMPLYLWYRQVARMSGQPLAQVRGNLQGQQSRRPRKVPKGTGRESRLPDEPEIRAALLSRMERTGWSPQDWLAAYDKRDTEEARKKT